MYGNLVRPGKGQATAMEAPYNEQTKVTIGAGSAAVPCCLSVVVSSAPLRRGSSSRSRSLLRLAWLAAAAARRSRRCWNTDCPPGTVWIFPTDILPQRSEWNVDSFHTCALSMIYNWPGWGDTEERQNVFDHTTIKVYERFLGAKRAKVIFHWSSTFHFEKDVSFYITMTSSL